MAGSNHDRTRRSLFQNVWHKWINDRLVKHAATDTGRGSRSFASPRMGHG
jgi:hypothetical protein